MSGLGLQDKGWISPPDSIYDDSSDSGEASAVDSFTGSEVTEPHSDGKDSKENTDVSSSSPCETGARENSFSGGLESRDKDASQEDGDVASLSEIYIGDSNIKIGSQHQAPSLDQEDNHISPTHITDAPGQVSRVKSKFYFNFNLKIVSSALNFHF